MFSALGRLLSRPIYIILYSVLVLSASMLWWYFTDIEIMFGNYGKLHTYIDIGLSIMMIIGFPLFITAIIYRGLLLGKRTDMNKKSFIGIIGGTIGTILSGCSCCGLTLASYFGLLPLMSLLPYDGLEIKALGTIGLIYALYEVLTLLEVCEWKKI